MCTSSSSPQVFSIDGTLLTSYHTFDFSGCAQSQTLIINVHGTSVQYHYDQVKETKRRGARREMTKDRKVDNTKIKNGQGNYVDFTKVVFNFVEATSLTISQTPLVGTVLAPLASMNSLLFEFKFPALLNFNANTFSQPYMYPQDKSANCSASLRLVRRPSSTIQTTMELLAGSLALLPLQALH